MVIKRRVSDVKAAALELSDAQVRRALVRGVRKAWAGGRLLQITFVAAAFAAAFEK